MALTDGLDYMPLEGRLGSGAMEGSSNAAGVTPEGVRAGDRNALQALVERRGPAVVAFCTQVCGPQAADRAAAEAFARFRAAVRDAPELDGLDPEALLRGATRHAAASMARQPSGPPPHGRLVSRGTQTCEHVPTMLAARANGALGSADLDRLARHMDRCDRCDALAEIFRRAELAYQDPTIETLGSETSSMLVAALQAVSDHGLGTAPAPAPDAPAVVALDGAFGHLPDLDDEVPVEVAPVSVEEPAAEPDAKSLPEDALAAAEDGAEGPTFYATGEHDAVDLGEDADLGQGADLGETAEWDELPEVAEEHGAPAAAPVLEGGHARRSGPRPLAVALPVLLVAVCVAAALALTGVFNGDDSTPPVDRSSAPTVEAPVTTPLPVKVKPKPVVPATPSSTGASSATPAGATGTEADASAGTGAEAGSTTP